MRATLSIVKRLLASNKISFIVTAVVVLCATTSGDSAIALSNGNYTWLGPAKAKVSLVWLLTRRKHKNK